MTLEIISQDAIKWLRGKRNIGSIVTGLPDMAEVAMTEVSYRGWFSLAIRLCMGAVSPGCPAVFCQTDRKANGGIISKSYIMMDEASKADMRLMWHKVVVRHGIGKTDLMRPGYSHFMAFGKEGCTPGKATPDVIEFTKALYDNGMDFKVANHGVLYAGKFSKQIVDPFCGRGTVPIIARDLGFDAVGIDLDIQQCKIANSLAKSSFPYHATQRLTYGKPVKAFLPPDSRGLSRV